MKNMMKPKKHNITFLCKTKKFIYNPYLFPLYILQPKKKKPRDKPNIFKLYIYINT